MRNSPTFPSVSLKLNHSQRVAELMLLAKLEG